MSRGEWKQIREVALWEFKRYVKPKQQIIGLVITLVFMLGGGMIGRLVGRPSTVELAVVGAERLALPEELGRFRIVVHEPSELDELRAGVEEGDLEAVLVLGEAEVGGELIVRHAPRWRGALERELTAIARELRLERSGLSASELASIQAPYELDLLELAPRAGGGEFVLAGIGLFLMFIGVMSGVGSIFASVTGEKQHRLSEQVISAISPQVWIDGKILGLAPVALVGVLNMVLAGVLVLVIGGNFLNFNLPISISFVRPDLIAVALVIAFLGFLFWFAFLAAIASVIDDPHTSNRNQFLFLPMLALVPAFLAIRDPGALWIRVLGVIPPTSASVQPMRLLVSEVPWWEVALSILLLLGAIYLIRLAAGKVFRLGMLMYGKEPSWAEVRRWIR